MVFVKLWKWVGLSHKSTLAVAKVARDPGSRFCQCKTSLRLFNSDSRAGFPICKKKKRPKVRFSFYVEMPGIEPGSSS
jgi:hypothetical protein